MECPDENVLNRFVSGALADDVASAVEAHLESCDACRDVVCMLAECLSPVSVADERSAVQEEHRASALPAGHVVGDRYVVLNHVASGAMGAVYRAYDDRLDRKVALKVLLEGVRGGDALIAEAQAAAKLTHPNVVVVHDVGRDDALIFISMEFVNGQTLRAFVSRSEPEAIVSAYVQAGRGLVAAHRSGLVHCDFKPDNAMIDAEGRVRVTDFGLALSSTPSSSQTDSTPSEARRGVRGTPAYMAPEVLLGSDPSHASDQFSFFIALFEALTSKRPSRIFGDPRRDEALDEALQEAGVGKQLREVIVRGLQLEPAARWPSLDVALARILRRPQRRWIPLTAGVVGLVAVAATWSRPECERATERIPGVWEPSRARALKRTLVDGERLDRKDWASLERRLDDYAGLWSDIQQTSCEALQDNEQSADMFDRRALCLGDARASLEGMLDELEVADDAADKVQVVLASLPSVERCNDREHLLGQPALPESAEDRARVRVLRDDIARNVGIQTLGHYEEALKHYAGYIERAEGLHLPTALEARRGQIRALQATTQFAAAQRSAKAGLLQAIEAGDAHGTTLMWSELSRVIVESGGDTQSALFFIDVARAYAEGKDDTGFVSELALVKADLLVQQGRLRDARQQYATALRMRLVHYGRKSQVIVAIVNLLGNVAYELGDYEVALARFDEALAVRISFLGRENSRVAGVLNNRGSVLRAMGRLDASEADHDEALRIREALLGPDHAEVGHVRLNLARLRMAQGRLDAAAREAEEAYRIYEDAMGPDHPHSLEALVVRAEVLLARGEVENAEAAYIDAETRAGRRLVARRARMRALVGLAELPTARGRHARTLLQLAWDEGIEEEPLASRARAVLDRVP